MTASDVVYWILYLFRVVIRGYRHFNIIISICVIEIVKPPPSYAVRPIFAAPPFSPKFLALVVLTFRRFCDRALSLIGIYLLWDVQTTRWYRFQILLYYVWQLVTWFFSGQSIFSAPTLSSWWEWQYLMWGRSWNFALVMLWFPRETFFTRFHQ